MLPADERSASVLVGRPGSERRARRALLWRTFVDLASRLVVEVPTPVEHVDLVAPERRARAEASVVEA
jgi:hypothetical protein